jgi:hypothetical protein
MTDISIEERRSEVHRLLKGCVDQKLLRGGTSEAISQARRAYSLATDPPSLPAPWPQLAAYRLAHLLMRVADLSVMSLREIDNLFAEASCGNRLGPSPYIYQIAVLSRLKSALDEGSEKDGVSERIRLAFEQAVGKIRQTHLLARDRPQQRVALQSAEFNLLEFAGYFLGAPYQPLEGLASLDFLDPLWIGRWFIVGPGIERIFMTKELASCEFQARASKGQYVLIELDNEVAKWGLSSPDGARLQEVNHDFAKLVLLSLETPRLGNQDLKRRVVGMEGANPDARFRTIKRRTKEALQSLLGQPDLEVFAGETLTHEIPILGLVHNPAFL